MIRFRHAPAIWSDFPQLVPGVLHAQHAGTTGEHLEHYWRIAAERLAAGTESGLPEIQAWRHAFARMGLKPTRYRCAAESLLRRFRREGSLPSIHPLIDLANAVSLAYAIPVAVFDADAIDGLLEVRYATGDETYLALSGETEHPEPGEVIFADEHGQAHARRWTHRQSARSAVSAGTGSVLIVAEALHAGAARDVPRLLTALGDELPGSVAALLTPGAPEFRTSNS
ncbi:B3/B4 domain-containing protein [Amycolatopsis granulosa]|uniref:B3/B4 domain-containing protein n=1 Tax=Amycolatopsis granulosa TaxID=185684 RepID=UPI001ABB1F37|nr:phenylalanine--tRNA ligase beta subunit-related protein [Amycolatopsis granulosa]NIH85114.1 DNA/RNA-binding domain of Phe-tRNA-synthetase-like protein [Amycolatopsis granulosa]